MNKKSQNATTNNDWQKLSQILNNYSLDQYTNDIDVFGLDITWDSILALLKQNATKDIITFIPTIASLYEYGLAHVDKINKKECGKYYTPEDVSILMAKWFEVLPGTNICDVCCGCGNLIFAFLRLIGNEKAKNLLRSGRVFLYDLDANALNICKTLLEIVYGEDSANKVHCIQGDFLSKETLIPCDSKIICNPPYSHIATISEKWEETDTLKGAKDFFPVFMEKIFRVSRSSVLVTPGSFLMGNKYYALRKEMNKYQGEIYIFDNAPGNIFNGKKHGIFNTNSTNSVRAAFTVTNNDLEEKGFRTTGLIRFKNKERKELLQPDTLKSFLGSKHQTITSDHSKYIKVFPQLEAFVMEWLKKGRPIKDYCASEGEITYCIPNTGRYYFSATLRNLQRTGKHYLSFSNEEIAKLAYCFLNSSFLYCFWRFFDGGITLTASLLKNLPVFFEHISTRDKESLCFLAEKMMSEENDYLTYKKNAGKMQENIKFPEQYRTKINDILLSSLGFEPTSSFFDCIYENEALRMI